MIDDTNTPADEPNVVNDNQAVSNEAPVEDFHDEMLPPHEDDPTVEPGVPVPERDVQPQPVPTEDAQLPPQEGEASEVQQEPEYAGDYVPNTNVDEKLQVLEELTQDELAKLGRHGALLLANQSAEELFSIERAIRRQLQAAQKDRRKLAENGAAGGFIPLEVEANGRKGIIYATEAERNALEVAEYYSRSLRHGTGVNTFTDGNTWTNLPRVGDTAIAMGQIDHSKSKDPVVRLRHELGLSNEHSVPLWGTGMHLSLMGPGTLENLTLDTKLLLEKIDYGRDSSAYVYSASSVYMNRIVADFLLEKITHTTAGTVDKDTLKNIILLTDLEPLALAGASTIYPDGYLLKRPCLTSKGGCGAEIERKVNLRRMLFVSDSKLTKDQMQLMTKRSGRVDVATIKNYQAQMRPHISRLVSLKNGKALRLVVPTLANYERVAGAWMDRISNQARNLIASNANSQERQVYLERVNAVALLMAYGHWIEAFVSIPEDAAEDPVDIVSRVGNADDTAQYTSDTTIDKLLEDLSGDSELTTKVVEAIEQFITDMTIATVAVPKAKCPKCGQPVSGDETSKHPHLVNINPIEVFFTLLRHKIMIAGG